MLPRPPCSLPDRWTVCITLIGIFFSAPVCVPYALPPALACPLEGSGCLFPPPVSPQRVSELRGSQALGFTKVPLCSSLLVTGAQFRACGLAFQGPDTLSWGGRKWGPSLLCPLLTETFPDRPAPRRNSTPVTTHLLTLT